MNELYYGDNLDVLRRHIADESVDLIYLDPPFQSGKDYNVLFEERSGDRSAAQIKAFEDTWRWDLSSREAWEGVVETGGDASRAMQAFMTFLGESDMLAYLSMMAPRLIELRRVLKPTGSIWLHCDPTASHYLKVLMDAIFGAKQFRNEIVWHYTGWNKKLASYFERRHDIILFYAKSDDQQFNSYGEPWDSPEEYVKVRKQKLRKDKDGRPYVLSDAGGGKRVKRYIDEAMKAGRPIDDVWDIDKLTSSSRERLSYPTQKPEALLVHVNINTITYGNWHCGLYSAIFPVSPTGGKDAKEEPVLDRADRRGASYPRGSEPPVYVTVSGRGSSQDHPPRCRGSGEQGDRRASGPGARGGEQVAKALPSTTPGGAGRSFPRRPALRFFPLTWWLR